MKTQQSLTYWEMPAFLWNKQEKAENIIRLVSQRLKITETQLKNKSRGKEAVADARMLCYMFIRKYTLLSHREIGDILGGRDHSTVLSGIQRIEDRIVTDDTLKRTAQGIEAGCKGYEFVYKLPGNVQNFE